MLSVHSPRITYRIYHGQPTSQYKNCILSFPQLSQCLIGQAHKSSEGGGDIVSTRTFAMGVAVWEGGVNRFQEGSLKWGAKLCLTFSWKLSQMVRVPWRGLSSSVTNFSKMHLFEFIWKTEKEYPKNIVIFLKSINKLTWIINNEMKD